MGTHWDVFCFRHDKRRAFNLLPKAFPVNERVVYTNSTMPATGSELIDLRAVLERVGVEPGMTIAELGSGTGFFSLLCADMVGETGRVYAVDVLKTALAAVMREARKQNYKNIVPVWSNLEVFRGAKQIQDASVDLALVINTLFQSTNQPAFLKESVRMVRPGGKMVIVDWKHNTSFGPPDIDRVEPEEIQKVLTSLGTQFLGAFEPGQYHFGQVYGKIS